MVEDDLMKTILQGVDTGPKNIPVEKVEAAITEGSLANQSSFKQEVPVLSLGDSSDAYKQAELIEE